MFSSKANVNTLTSLLAGHGIHHAVVCPGSRNAPIVHNLNECDSIRCYPVTDERSAGFFALGIAQNSDEPVVVCVTSGTALLNLAPAVAEAHYQHQSLIVVSADRPSEWIGQLDGQTLQQPGALAPWVACTVSLPPSSEVWHCNRLVNEALMAATSEARPCVHINVPISEPLFDFTAPCLPCERIIRRYSPPADYGCLPQPLVDDLFAARCPMIVFGQLSPRRFHYEGLDALFSHVIVIHEALSPLTSISLVDDVLACSDTDTSELCPDFILHVGDAIVSKRLKHFLRQADAARTWRVSLTGDVEDTFQNLRGIVVGDAEQVLQSLSVKYGSSINKQSKAHKDYRRTWLRVLRSAEERQADAAPSSPEEAAVAELERQLSQTPSPFDIHYANSTAVRLANRYAKGHPVWCNRGTNGIEGSLSTVAGFAAVNTAITLCVIGDLSFFYDQNALWNSNIGGNLRILLLNNGHGAIFDTLPGLQQSPAAPVLVSGQHDITARGICQQNGVDYRSASGADNLKDEIAWLLKAESPRPMLLEVKCRE